MYNFLGYCLAAYGIVFITLIVWFVAQIKIEKELNKSSNN
jgi:hypothetical protein